jgi:hypothetical protein
VLIPPANVAQNLRGVYTGRIQNARLRELYANDAQFRCLLPGREADVMGGGPAAMQVAASLPTPATVVAWKTTPSADG